MKNFEDSPYILNSLGFIKHYNLFSLNQWKKFFWFPNNKMSSYIRQLTIPISTIYSIRLDESFSKSCFARLSWSKNSNHFAFEERFQNNCFYCTFKNKHIIDNITNCSLKCKSHLLYLFLSLSP